MTHLPGTNLTSPLPGAVVFTALGPYLIESDQSDVPAGYVLARRAERPMSQPRLLRLRDIVASAPGRLTSAAGAPAPAC